jgi:hypothetical protein
MIISCLRWLVGRACPSRSQAPPPGRGKPVHGPDYSLPTTTLLPQITIPIRADHAKPDPGRRPTMGATTSPPGPPRDSLLGRRPPPHLLPLPEEVLGLPPLAFTVWRLVVPVRVRAGRRRVGEVCHPTRKLLQPAVLPLRPRHTPHREIPCHHGTPLAPRMASVKESCTAGGR